MDCTIVKKIKNFVKKIFVSPNPFNMYCTLTTLEFGNIKRKYHNKGMVFQYHSFNDYWEVIYCEHIKDEYGDPTINFCLCGIYEVKKKTLEFNKTLLKGIVFPENIKIEYRTEND